MPYKWLTPNSPPPDDERGRCFSVPDDVELIAAVSGALLPLTYAANWEQFGSMTPDEAASIMSAAFEIFVNGDCCDGCTPKIAGRRLVRISPITHKFEQISDDGETWETPDGDLTVPPQTGRDEPTDDERKCSAAANAAHVMHLLYDEALELYENEIDPAAALDFWGEYAGEILFEALGVLVSHFAPLVGYMWTTLYGVMEILTYNAWRERLERDLTCLFLEHATIDSGIVTFDYPAIQTGLFTSAHTQENDLLVLGQVWYMLAIIGADGLNLAGETTAVDDAECPCGTWYRTWEYDALGDNPDWDILQGVVNFDKSIGVAGTWVGSWAAAQMITQTTDETTIVDVEFKRGYPNSNYTQLRLWVGDDVSWVHSGGPDDAPYGGADMWKYLEHEGYANANWELRTTLNKTLPNGEFPMTYALRSGHGAIVGIRMRGYGPCPFTSGDTTSWE